MSNNRFDVLERFAPLFEAPEPSFEGFLFRRDRTRRNQRIAAGIVGMAVFLASVWIVTTAGPFDRTQTPAVTGPTVPPEPTRVGFIGMPPEGATPSTPENGVLVLSLYGSTAGPRSRVWVYADGRMIWQKETDLPYGANLRSTGYLEQRLTARGVELLRSEVLSTGLFDDDLHLVNAHGLFDGGAVRVRSGDRLVRVTWGWMGPQDVARTMPTPEQASALQRLDARLADPSSWLPENAWEDPEIRAYVPSRYSVCFDVGVERIERSLILNILPEPAADLLRAKDETRAEGVRCSEMTTEEARAFVGALDDEGVRQDEVVSARALQYILWAPDPIGIEVLIFLEPIFPHGEWTCSPCG